MSSVQDFRTEKDQVFRDYPDSPLTPEQRESFAGLNYYPENADYNVVATLEPLDEPEPITLITSRGTIQEFYRIGKLHFTLDGSPQVLTLFQNARGQNLFLPFTDATSGDETYGAGRYVEVEVEGMEGGRHLIRIDFNLAYNPFCAYNEAWICPIPPAENRLTVPVPAGEKNFQAE